MVVTETNEAIKMKSFKVLICKYSKLGDVS